jgi:hypothetical protein
MPQDFSLTTGQAAALLRSANQTVRNYADRGILPCLMVRAMGAAGRALRYRAADVLALAALHPRGPERGRPRKVRP